MASCVYCGGQFIAVHSRGRPQLYCSGSCKEAKKYEVGRLNERLKRLEDRRSEVVARGRKWEQGMVSVLDRQIQEAAERLESLSSGASPYTTQ